jgi:hypothetical protein
VILTELMVLRMVGRRKEVEYRIFSQVKLKTSLNIFLTLDNPGLLNSIFVRGTR